MHTGQITTCYNFKFLKNKYISNKIIHVIQNQTIQFIFQLPQQNQNPSHFSIIP